MQHMAMVLEKNAESAYPERPGEPDCGYYVRNGLCGYGARCRFNHPPSTKLPPDQAVSKEHFPERIGQPGCQYYLLTSGACKYGSTCKYHHPWERAASPKGEVKLNLAGLPMRLGERECMHYTRTGSCKFGLNCKFHHPQPGAINGNMMPVPSSPIYTLGTSLEHVPYHGGAPTWFVARASYLPGLQVPAPTSYTPIFLPPQWTAFKGPISPIAPLDGVDLSPKVLGSTVQKADVAGTVSKNSRASLPPSVHGEEFPEREGQPECQYYLKTGDCKFGASCKFHHPRDRVVPMSPSSCTLSVAGLPLRPGQPQCSFHKQYGICKFGPVCKFDHPVVVPVHKALSSSVLDMTAGHCNSPPSAANVTIVTVPSPKILHAAEHITELSAKEGSGSTSYMATNPTSSPPEHAENCEG